MIKFLLNEEAHTVSDVDPNTMVLDYLREHLRRIGTKEGCASGDCGACTVVIGTVVDKSIRYDAINACITPVGNLHGKQLITVEDLKESDQLHSVQQAMVDLHGSQCGFCTPGFIMSMLAYSKNNQQYDRATVNEALGGNLCRCTGYRPIIDAAKQMFETDREDQFSSLEQTTISALDNISIEQGIVELSGNGKIFFSPTTVQELAGLMAQYPEARLVAGGTDLSLEVTQFLREIDTLIFTGRVAELRTITLTDDALIIGAAATYTEFKDPLIDLYPDLHELIERLGSRQIRNQGTLGGNVGNASPIGDMPPVLIALGASLVLRKGEQTRIIPVEDYFVSYKVTAQQPSEFIERIIIPKPQSSAEFRVYKISKRLDDDISATCGAFSMSISQGKVANVAIAFGGMAEVPKRANHCEQALLGEAWDEATLEKAMAELAKDFTPITDFRSSAEYRLKVSQNLLRRFFLELQDSTTQLRVTHYA